jgi:hypothetical protein
LGGGNTARYQLYPGDPYIPNSMNSFLSFRNYDSGITTTTIKDSAQGQFLGSIILTYLAL